MIQREWEAFRTAFDELDSQTFWVLSLCCVFGLWSYTLGGKLFWSDTIAPALGLSPKGLIRIAWHYGSTFVVCGVLPALVLIVAFKRKPSEIGLGLGDWRFALAMLAIWIPVATLGAWILSDLPSFGNKHPYFKPARASWEMFVMAEGLLLLYWIGWEYLWRGFTLFGTAPTLGYWAIFAQMLPFAAFHAHKPWPEAYLSVIGGLILGAIVWRCRSFWVAVPLHAWQMMAMDVFCVLRKHGNVDGIGPQALLAVLGIT